MSTPREAARRHMDFTGKRVFVTGSTEGLGRATAEAFHELGATVAINGRSTESVERAIGVMGGGPRLIAAPGDLSLSDVRKRTVAQVLTNLGGIDTLVNNAGRGDDCVINNATESYWRRMIDLNIKAVFFTAQACVPELRRSRGSIINVSSALGLIAGPAGSGVYSVTKGAVLQMTRMMALALAADGVRVNAVCPGWVDTPMIQKENGIAGNNALYDYINSTVPIGRIGTPAEMVGMMLFLASPENSYTTGAIISADGGTSCGY